MDTSDFPGGPPEPGPSNPQEPPREDAALPPAPSQGSAQPAPVNRNRRRRNRRGHPGRPGQQHTARSDRQPRHNGQGNRQRGATFTGPMDHSYRQQQNGGSGNSLNDSAGTQQRFPRRGGRFRPQFGKNRNSQQGFPPRSQHFHANLDPVPFREDAVTRIFAFVDDLFFMTKIMDTAKKLNVKVEFVKTLEDLEKLTASEEQKPSLVIFDLNNANAKPLTTIPKVKARFKKGTSILGFVSHVQGDLKLKAQEAGCDSVMPRSAFSQNLPQILRRHGAPEDLEQAE